MDCGADSFSFVVYDGENNSNESTVDITISVVNDSPVFLTTTLSDATEDSEYSFTLSVDDIDSQDLTISSQYLPSWLLLDNGILTGTPISFVEDEIFEIVTKPNIEKKTARRS